MIDPIEFAAAQNQFIDDLAKRGLRSGPHYHDDNGGHGLVWYDQVFERDIAPVGTVNCKKALRVGNTLNSLDVVLVACHANTEKLIIPAGATITVSFLQGDSEMGTFEDVGPTICVTAPLGGMEIEPDCQIARFPMGVFQKPWLMVNVEFSGAITGGNCDCGIGYTPR